MSNRIVINTGPLIALGKMAACDLAAQLPLEFVCPAQVETEIGVGLSQGYGVPLPAWLSVLPLQAPLPPLASLTLDNGEAAVIQSSFN